nr:vitellogenin 1 [Procambarus clarkii]
MTSLAAQLLTLILVAGVRAAPGGGDTSVCSRECPVAGAPKFFYQPGKTYAYEYSGNSKVKLEGVEGGHTETSWSAQVEVSWITPCDMVISVKDYKTDGDNVPAAARFLERYPLVVAVADGRVQHVCSHHDDDAWSINMKKGVASIFQNSLPSNSSFYTGQNVIETDVLGTCPTRYEVHNHRDRVIMKKEKNHRVCKQRYPTPAETQVPWLKGLLPLEKSHSMCQQEIKNGIYSSITCEDENVVRPSYGLYKYIEARQESTLRFISESNDQSAAASAIPQANMERKSLRYDYDTLKKDPSMVAQLDQTMKQICEKTKDAVERDVAALVAKAAQLLRRVPEEAITQTLDKIRSGQFCQDHKKLEQLFLDVVVFIHESGSVKVMVKELTSGHTSVVRRALYSAALFSLPRPSIHAMVALKPLFESAHPLPMATLAGASLVNTYCRHNHNCDEIEPVKSLAEALGHKLQRQCSPSDDEETEKAALTTLKALGNMGIMTQEVARSVLRCMETEGVKNNIRVAAAQAFRQTKCHHQSTEQLVNFSVDIAMASEVRIAAYLMAVRCAEKKNLELIITKISQEENTQVRGFILSHLLNLQQSYAPEKVEIRYLLSNIVIPRNFNKDIRKYSRNIDLAYFSPALGAGAGVESNIIYSPGSFVPRSIDFNLTAALEGILMNLGEVGVRLEGLEPIFEEIFGPEGYVQKTSLRQILKDVTRFIKQTGGTIFEHFLHQLRTKRSVDFSHATEIFEKIYNSDKLKTIQADIFARFMGQEISFASFSGEVKDISVDKMTEFLLSYISDILNQIKTLNVNIARTFQISFDYSFPTIQGTPFKLMMEGTAVTGLQIEGNLNPLDFLYNWKKGNNSIKIIPSVSVYTDGFIGYDTFLTKTGIKANTTLSKIYGATLNVKPQNNTEQNEMEVQWDLPEHIELINVKSETYLMKSERGSPETKIIPPSMKDIRIRTQSCINNLEPILGLKLCYELDIPDIFRSNSLPFGAPTIAKLYVEKEESSLTGYRMTVVTQDKKESKMAVVKVESSGSSTPKEAEVTLSHIIQGNACVISARLRSSAVTSGIWVTIINEEGHKGVEVYANYKSNRTELSRGIKIDVITESTPTKNKYELDIYISRNRYFPPESQIFESKFVGRFRECNMSVDFLFTIKNALRNYFVSDIEFGADLRHTTFPYILMLTKLRKFEFHGEISDWQIISFIHQTKESGESAEHSSSFKITKRNEDLVNVVASHTTKGTLNENFVTKTKAKVKIGSTGYKTSSTIFYEDLKKGASLEVIRASDGVKVADLEVMNDRSDQSCYTLVLVDIPEYMRAIKFESKAAEQGEDQYMLQAAIKHGELILLRAQGPLTATFSSNVTILKTDIKLELFGRVHRVAATLNHSEHRLLMDLDVKNERQSLLSCEWNMLTEPNIEKTTIGFKFLLPVLMDSRVDAIVGKRVIYLNTDTLLFPQSSFHRRIISGLDLDFEHYIVATHVSWDADADPNKRLSAYGRFFTRPSNPKFTFYIGTVKWLNETYIVKMNLTEANLLAHFQGENGLELEIITAANKTCIYEVKNTVQQQHNSINIHTRFRYKNLENNDYRLASVIGLESLGSPYNYKLALQLNYMSPEGHTTSLTTKAMHHSTPEARVIYVKSATSTSSTRKPLQVEFQSSSEENSYNIHWKADLDSPVTMFKWDMVTHQEGGVKSLESSIDMTAVRDLIKTALSMIEGRGDNEDIMEEQHNRESYKERQEDYNTDTDKHRDRESYEGRQREDYDSGRDEYGDNQNYKRGQGKDYDNDRSEYQDRQSYQGGQGKDYDNDRSEYQDRESYQGGQGKDYDNDRSEYQDRQSYQGGQGKDYDNDRSESQDIVEGYQRDQGEDYANKTGKPLDDKDNKERQGEDYDNDRGEYQDRPGYQIRKREAYRNTNDMDEHHVREIYSCLYQNPTPNTFAMIVKSPSRTMEGDVEYSPSASSLRFYPNKAKSEAKYEIAAKSSHSYRDHQSKYEGRISHPRLARDLQVKVQHSGSGEELRGSIELDVFPDTADKIVGTFQSTKTANNTIKIEVALATRILMELPKVTIVMAYAPHTAGIDLQFQKSPSSPVTFQVSAIYDRVSPRDATMAFRVINDRVSVVDIAGTTQREEDPECNGHKVKAVAHISSFGSYEVHSKFCKPAFIQLSINKLHSQYIYAARCGFQTPKNAEVSLAVEFNGSPQRYVIAEMQAQLTSPTLISVDVAFVEQHFTRVKNNVVAACRRVMGSVQTWAGSVYNYMKDQAQQRGILFPNPQILSLINQVDLDLREIYEDVYDVIVPKFEAFCHTITPVVAYVQQYCYDFLLGLADAQKFIVDSIVEELLYIRNESNKFTMMIMNRVMDAARWMQFGMVPPWVEDLRQQLEKTRIYTIFKNIYDAITARYPEECEAVWNMASKFRQTLWDDINILRLYYFRLPPILRTLLWLVNSFVGENWVIFEANALTSEVNKEILLVSVEKEKHHMNVQIPLHTPMYSLTQVLQTAMPYPITIYQNVAWRYDTFIPVSINDLIWAYYTLLPRHKRDVLPPYNRTAMVVSDTEILTFDGAVLRAPPSPCEVILAIYKSNKLTMSHPERSSPPQITLSTHSTTVVIKADFRVEINGQEMSMAQVTVGELTIQKTPQEVSLTLPYMSVRIFLQRRVISVNVGGWAFGHITGLLGSYDGETGNDWLMPSGVRASSLQELVFSWQESQECRTPPVPPVSPDNINILWAAQCNELLEIRSRCSPLISPEPFIKICYGITQTCRAAYAYQTMCSTRGIDLVFPTYCK